MTIREELKMAAEYDAWLMSGMATAIVYFGFCHATESPETMTRLEESIFLLLCAEAL